MASFDTVIRIHIYKRQHLFGWDLFYSLIYNCASMSRECISVSVSVGMGVYLDISLICNERAELGSNLWVTLKLINVLPVTCVESECPSSQVPISELLNVGMSPSQLQVRGCSVSAPLWESRHLIKSNGFLQQTAVGFVWGPNCCSWSWETEFSAKAIESLNKPMLHIIDIRWTNLMG